LNIYTNKMIIKTNNRFVYYYTHTHTHTHTHTQVRRVNSYLTNSIDYYLFFLVNTDGKRGVCVHANTYRSTQLNLSPFNIYTRVEWSLRLKTITYTTHIHTIEINCF
jgi:hypothetical protein